MTLRRASWLAVVGLVVVALALGASPGDAPPSLEARADAIASELRCPVCQGLSVKDSDSDTARSIRDDIRERLASGASDAEVRQAYVDRFGQWILLRPPADGFGALVWVLPAMALVAAAGGLALALRRWRRSHAAAGAGPGDRQIVARALGRAVEP
ncbi:MAG: cytochrome c-type biogenesis protein CcmH [Actinobacteria bacterium]|nr:cytochrome c-type biogenesis protein CcmH [Actinomycetota bacterium]